MSQVDLNNLISRLESARNSRVLAYITSDNQPPFRAQISSDIVPVIFDHLKKIGKTEKIDLLIYSGGGDIVAPWRLVNLIREYADKFSVLVPYKAHSAATMIALGADEIVMGRLAELSPIDPNIRTPFNPPHHDVPNEPKIEISVEDLFGYINLAKEKLGIIGQTNLVNILAKLIDKIHPLAIGAVYRTHSLIRLLAAKLLGLHMNDKKEKKQINQIVDNLVEKLYYHNYLINRNEAAKLGLKITFPSDEVEQLMWDIYLRFKDEMNLGQLFNPMELIPEHQQSFKMEIYTACICSSGLHSQYRKSLELSKLPPQQIGGPPQIGIQENLLGWKDIEARMER